MTAASPEATGAPRPEQLTGAAAFTQPPTGTPSGPPADPRTEPPTEAPIQPEGDTVAGTRFAHASEAEMARILDFYAVRWEYEPTTFPILWNLDGEVVESFAPDFYLPDLEMFLEMTTLKQRLVRKKNRKLRRLRELYPDIRIKLFYARDFRAMMLKYGRLGLAESLSGTPGQVVPDHAPVPPIAAVEVADAVGRRESADSQDAGGLPVVLPSPTAGIADHGVEPSGSRSAARSRPGRRRRHARKPAESRVDREAGT